MKKTQLLDLIRRVQNRETSRNDDQRMEFRFVERKLNWSFLWAWKREQTDLEWKLRPFLVKYKSTTYKTGLLTPAKWPTNLSCQTSRIFIFDAKLRSAHWASLYSAILAKRKRPTNRSLYLQGLSSATYKYDKIKDEDFVWIFGASFWDAAQNSHFLQSVVFFVLRSLEYIFF